ncbi:uncharacterized protein LOC133297121 [Gastrolobium bilobum]|uniref:uncharacterized protein LOC133297121 n=1 Tax=Gastrolobium bilobum TaxID=150636 RepID=UPI002AB10A5B|nr:uncharacterized protein LOC133297121 [Gastrolobium bilobum]
MPKGVQRDETKFCEFHNDKGHTTEKCFALKNTIEALIREGKLQEFVSSYREYKTQRRRDRSPDRDPNPNEQRAHPRRNYNPARNKDRRNDREASTDRRQGTPPRNRQQIAQQQRDGLPNNAAGVLATIAGGSAGGGATKSQRKKHLKSVMTVHDHARPSTSRDQRQAISFDDDDYGDILPDHDDPLVISACMANLQVKRIMIDNGSSADIIFWDAFRAMHIPEEHLLHGCSDLIGFAGKCVQPKGTIEMWVTFGIMPLARTIKVRFYVVEYASAYNIILGRPTIVVLKAIITMPHLLMKFRDKSSPVVAIRGDQKTVRSCYNTSLRAKIPIQPDDKVKASVNMTGLDMCEDLRDTRPQPDGECKNPHR